ncbi:Cytochrome c biogenesis ATP-binding export protein CcmA [Tritonibacter multivorans]|uniref:Cytochrome c biogenesis ATP-binding export protein CcmA n=1 Tax=Tritonibacter multivorans TaxID=928856 RepID=A0A0P1H2F4_9RHOB|nr:heme ABC exporter ATP-binding protein CcmA [Tritonibacter multivorans]MDA7420487.1 heme ABC exporter ATP-binding protein CcmA [Tritonibacter multivorans]CUH81504.1 Cytochrome c biogenesis ATP-binding export protein CcmA [Tritonibacter multivorans]SFC36897.1 heme exporter protein A [Tritonibacter multivorans]
MTLQITDLSLARGGVPVLAGLSFTLGPGRALILRGPNGVGKTTLLRTVAGLQPPLAGTITGAEDQIAYGGHSDGLKLGLTVTENLRFWAQIFGQRDFEPALEAFNLAELRDRPAGGLSAGQKRRLSLARLMVTRRPIWVLDEPTVSLDAASVQLFAASVEAHLAAGGSALMATHIDLGLDGDVLDLGPFKAKATAPVADGFDEVFL